MRSEYIKKVFAVSGKELKDNLRDRRSLFFSLFYGPVLMPILLIVPMMFGVSKYYVDQNISHKLYVEEASDAEDLLDFLQNHNFEILDAPEDYAEKIENKTLDLVLKIDSDFNKAFRKAHPAEVTLIYNSSAKNSNKIFNQTKGILQQYSATVKQLRFHARGIDSSIFTPLFIVEQDSGHSSFDSDYTGFIIYFLSMFAMITGGLYLAVECVAGEREKRTFEPLLSLPISRTSLLQGKFLAVLSFILISYTLVYIITFLVFFSSAQIESTQVVQISYAYLLNAWLICLPCLVLFSSVLVLISTYTKTSKEAQTYSGIIFFIPMLPLLAKQFLETELNVQTALMPLYSHHQFISKLFSSQPLDFAHIAISTVATIAISIFLFLLSMRRFRSEKILMG